LSYVPAAEEAATYFVRAAWLISDGEEGSPSDIAILIVPEGNTLVATAVNPPAQASGLERVCRTVGHGTDTSERGALPINGQWTLPVAGLQQGTPAGTGQAPDSYLRPGPNVLWR